MKKKFVLLVSFIFLMVCCFSMIAIAEPARDWQGQNCFLANGISQTATPVVEVVVWVQTDVKSLMLSEAACASCHGDSRASPSSKLFLDHSFVGDKADFCNGTGGGLLKIDI